MAKDTKTMADANTAQAAGAAPAKRKRRSSGPKKVKPFHAVFRVVDANGQPIEGAKLEIGLIAKNTETVLDFMDANAGKGYIRQKIDVPVSETRKQPTENAAA